MTPTMTLGSAAAMFAAMAVLAAVPSVSVLAVATRSASAGFAQGAWTALGIVAGDLAFILVAIFGLALVAQAADGVFVLIRYIGGAYLIWLGMALVRRPRASRPHAAGASGTSSFMTGLLVTLGDQKAILFYLGFFPAFVDLARLTASDTLVIVALAVVVVGGVKLAYAYAAERASALVSSGAGGLLVRLGAATMIGARLWVIAGM